MPKRSWRTTSAGVTLIASTLTAVGGAVALLPDNWWKNPTSYLILAGVVGGGLSAGIGLIAARDNGVRSEDAIKPKAPKGGA